MKQTVQYIVYCVDNPKKHTGLLGDIDLYIINLLLIGGRVGIEEKVENKDPLEWYKNVLEEQDMVIKYTYIQKLKDIQRIWIEIDSEKTPIHEYTSWKEIDSNNIDTLAWKPYLIPCFSETKKECLGLGVVSKEKLIFSLLLISS